MKESKFQRFANLLSGDELPDHFTLKLRPSEDLMLWTLLNNEAVNVNRLINIGIDRNSIHIVVVRLRKKLPTGVKIETRYGGFYYMTEESKKVLRKYER